VILQEGIGRISSDDFESLCASEFGREPQVVQDSREKEELLVVAQVLRLPDQGAENESPHHACPHDGRRDPIGQVNGFLS
jgi:hypothetical protein